MAQMAQQMKTAETENSKNSLTDEAVKTVEHYIDEGPRKPVLQEKQVFLVL